MIERDIRFDGDGAANVIDRFGSLAGLVRDDAEHMRRLGIVGIGGGGAAGQLVGIR